MSKPVPPRKLWLLVMGFCLWAGALVILYAWHAVGCVFGWPTGALRLGLGLAFGLHLIAILWLWRAQAATRPDPASGPTGTFMHWVIVASSLAALATIILTLGPALLLKTCI